MYIYIYNRFIYIYRKKTLPQDYHSMGIDVPCVCSMYMIIYIYISKPMYIDKIYSLNVGCGTP